MTNQEIKVLVANWNIKLENGNQLVVYDNLTAEAIAIIKSNKQTIIDYFLQRESEKKNRENKINNIEGLEELKKAISEWAEYNYQNEKRFDSERTSSFGIKKPTSNLDNIKAKYPRANAYLITREWAIYAENINKKTAGEKALERIIDGEDCKVVLKDMEQEWQESCQRNMWN